MYCCPTSCQDLYLVYGISIWYLVYGISYQVFSHARLKVQCRRTLEMDSGKENMHEDQGPVSQKILSPLVILSMEKTMVTKVISELKSISRLKIFRETGPRSI